VVIGLARQITLDEFKQALQLLDSKLKKLHENNSGLPIAINAIGGFALMYHNVRVSALTFDIDTITMNYSSDVENAIKEVSVELNIADDWLNNYNVLENDIKTIEAMLRPRWEKSNWEFEKIELSVADLEALLRSKLMAAEDDRLTDRMQDYPDLLAICVALGCDSIDEVVEQCEVMSIDLQKEYPWNYKRLQKDIEQAYKDWEKNHQFA
jgi:hypothetical protein